MKIKTTYRLFFICFTLLILLASLSSAQELSDYPNQFLSNGNFNGYFVVGSKGSSSDSFALTNVVMGMQNVIYPKDIPSDATKIDFDASMNNNLIAVGNPCANSITAQIVGSNECDYLLDDDKIGVVYITKKSGYTYLAFWGVDDPATLKLSKMIANSDSSLTGTKYFLMDKDYDIEESSSVKGKVSADLGIPDPDTDPEFQAALADGSIEALAEQMQCMQDSDCDDSNPATIDKCQGMPTVCTNEPIGCAYDDGICPEGCTVENDNDCDSCTSDSECIKDNPCMSGTCEGSPKECEYPPEIRCSVGNECIFVGDIKDNNYCSSDGSLKETLALGYECSFDYQCDSNNCADGMCKATGIFGWVINLFIGLF